MKTKTKKITTEPFPPTDNEVLPAVPCYAVIREECTDKLIWSDGPYNDARSALRAAGRKMARMQKASGRGLLRGDKE